MYDTIGSIFKDQGKLEQSISHYQEAIKLDPLCSDAYSNLGNVYKELGQMEEAVTCYKTAIKVGHTDNSRMYMLVYAY